MTLAIPASNPWVVRPSPNPDPALRLFCVPHAGGAPHAFQGWPLELPRHVEVCAVNLPGRGKRFAELAYDRLGPLVRDLAAGLSPWLDRPFALFGHSMGAVVAFELARVLRSEGKREPVHLFVSGASAPQLPRLQRLHLLTDSQLIAELVRMNGLERELLEETELLHLVLPTIRRDLEAAETHECAAGVPLTCPLSVFGGADDWLAPSDRLSSWDVHTTGACRVDVFEGDHFFVNSARRQLLEAVSARLALTGAF
jgi:medium-chain acyl-[acyl-carrier-protein] hydrolase